MRDKTIKVTDGSVVFFSPPGPPSPPWRWRFGIQVRRPRAPYLGLMLTPGQARQLAAELVRRAHHADLQRQRFTT